MAHYLVRARPHFDLLPELQARLVEGALRLLRPFGPALTRALEGARWDPTTGEAIWEEEDYCRPPLAQERAAVLDRYFFDLRVEPVATGEGWSRIAGLPSLWSPQDLEGVGGGPAVAGPACDWTTGACGF